MLAENHAELAQVMQDAFEDAVLMGVDEAAMRRILIAMVEGLESPKRCRRGVVAALLLSLTAAGPPPAAPAAPAAPSGTQWVPRGTAELIALNKIDAQSTPLRVPVGQSVRYGSLTIAVRSLPGASARHGARRDGVARHHRQPPRRTRLPWLDVADRAQPQQLRAPDLRSALGGLPLTGS